MFGSYKKCLLNSLEILYCIIFLYRWLVMVGIIIVLEMKYQIVCAQRLYHTPLLSCDKNIV